ncbi:MAG: peptidoglycan-binding protein [Chloracidobacterium sp.]|nr:peptidoglycan-binding protein [Chloracidobacterium sp.]
MLKSKGKFSGEATGVSSAEWKTAVKAYQGDNGLTKTGSLNRATLEKMGIALTDKQKDIPVNPDHIASDDASPQEQQTARQRRKPNQPTAQNGRLHFGDKDQITCPSKDLDVAKDVDGRRRW